MRKYHASTSFECTRDWFLTVALQKPRFTYIPIHGASWVLRPCEVQPSLVSYKDKQEYLNAACSELSYYTFHLNELNKRRSDYTDVYAGLRLCCNRTDM